MTVALRRVVVVGASLAGLRAAEALRAEGFDGELTLVGAEEHPPYNRPPLSKELLAGDAQRDEVHLQGTGELAATWRLGVRATGLDMDTRSVALDDGTELGFDGLVIATGSDARAAAGRRRRPTMSSCCARSTTACACAQRWPAPRASPSSGAGSSAARWRRPRASWAAR